MVDFTAWERAATWLAGVAAALAGLVWRDVRLRITEIEEALDGKADAAAFDRRGEEIQELRKSLHSLEVGMTRLSEQMARVVSDANSEKGTRKRTTEHIMEKLDRLTSSVEKRAVRMRHDNGDHE